MPTSLMIDTQRIREDFPILDMQVYDKPLVYLDNAATSHKPQVVLDRVRSFYTQGNSNIHRGVHYLSEKASAEYEAARETVQRFIGAEHAREIIFTRGTTEAINLVASCLGEDLLSEGDEVLITEMEHHSNIVPWQALCQRTGAKLQVLPFDDEGVLCMGELEQMVNERTKLIALCAVSNVLGTCNPVKEITRIAHARDIPVVVDAAQGVQHSVVDVQEWDADFVAFSGHKMYAEMGIGVLYGKERWLNQMRPYQYGGGMIGTVDFNGTTYAEIPYKFESGTPNVGGAIGLAAAIEYLQEVGLEGIAAHERDLLQQAAAGLREIDGITLYGNGNRAGVVSFNMEDVSPYDLSMILDKMGIAVRSGHHCAEPLVRHFGVHGMVRASVGLYNNEQDIEAFLKGVRRAQAMFC